MREEEVRPTILGRVAATTVMVVIAPIAIVFVGFRIAVELFGMFF